jgi:hypothetical protein
MILWESKIASTPAGAGNDLMTFYWSQGRSSTTETRHTEQKGKTAYPSSSERRLDKNAKIAMRYLRIHYSKELNFPIEVCILVNGVFFFFLIFLPGDNK